MDTFQNASGDATHSVQQKKEEDIVAMTSNTSSYVVMREKNGRSSRNGSDKHRTSVHTQSQNIMQITNKQRLFIENNRRKALEKKNKENCSSTPFEVANSYITARLSSRRAHIICHIPSEAPQLSSSELSSVHALQPSDTIQRNHNTHLLTEEQSARMENNQRKALEKKTIENGATSHLILTSSNSPTSTILSPEVPQQIPSSTLLVKSEQNINAELINITSRHSSNALEQSKKAKALTEEQRLRIENNRRKALEKKQKRCAASSLPADVCKLSVANAPCMETQPTLAMTDNKASVSQKLLQAAEKILAAELATPILNRNAPIINIQHANTTPPNKIRAHQDESKKAFPCLAIKKQKLASSSSANTITSTSINHTDDGILEGSVLPVNQHVAVLKSNVSYYASKVPHKSALFLTPTFLLKKCFGSNNDTAAGKKQSKLDGRRCGVSCSRCGNYGS